MNNKDHCIVCLKGAIAALEQRKTYKADIALAITNTREALAILLGMAEPLRMAQAIEEVQR